MRTSVIIHKAELAQRRRWRIRKRVAGSPPRPRLAFHRSLRHLYAQVVDDEAGRTLAHATTDTKANRASAKKHFANVAQAKVLGAQFGALLKEKGVTAVVFDRGGHRYHGVVKAFADAVREQGIKV
jgi:large subunit ribosomal protein L18